MPPIRILIADDHQLFRDGLHGLLDAIPDLEVVGEAATGDEIVALAASLQPSVILMDIKMPGLNGIAATRAILAANPQIGILVLTMFADEDSVFAAMRAGARGYLLKAASHEELLRAIRDVSNGKASF
jgi:DNA-binding NarL/FixJ family response regulator